MNRGTKALVWLLLSGLLVAACGSSGTPHPEEMNMPMGSGTPEATMAMGSGGQSMEGMGNMPMSNGTLLPPDLDTSDTRMSNDGLFQVSFTSSQAEMAINQIFSWTVHVETPEGTPVDDAQIQIDTNMPQHGHPMPTLPEVTANLGGGDYQIDGLKYSMPGWWEISLTITADGEQDSVTFNQLPQ